MVFPTLMPRRLIVRVASARIRDHRIRDHRLRDHHLRDHRLRFNEAAPPRQRVAAAPGSSSDDADAVDETRAMMPAWRQQRGAADVDLLVCLLYFVPV